MGNHININTPQSKYQHVYYNNEKGFHSKRKKRWNYMFSKNGKKSRSGISYKTDREAAVACDKQLIELGFEPVNVFKKK